MEDTNQMFVPESFMALYTLRGRATRGREEIEGRYEFCEDLAGQVSEICKTVQFSADLSESAALRKCLDGLMAPPTSVSGDEARWTMCRAAELLQWEIPGWLAQDGATAA